NSGSSAWLPK
ncbi:peptidase M3 family protein, partial [Vibrio parahaemolyticus VP2007-007]